MKDIYWPIMSEYVFWYILLREKDILHFIEKQQTKEWNQFAQWTIEWKKIGFLWTGSIAQPIAKVAKAFGMTTKGMSYSWQTKDYFDKTYSLEWIDEFCNWLDYLVNILPNTKETFNFVDNKFWSRVPNTCYFINVWRWANVHEKEIIDAINEWKIAWATLDVFHQEPLPKENTLRDSNKIRV